MALHFGLGVGGSRQDIVRGYFTELLNAKKLIRDNDKITDVDGVVRLFAESRDPQVMHMLATVMPATLTAAREMQTEAGVRLIWAVKIGAIDTRGYPAPDSDELFYNKFSMVDFNHVVPSALLWTRTRPSLSEFNSAERQV